MFSEFFSSTKEHPLSNKTIKIKENLIEAPVSDYA